MLIALRGRFDLTRVRQVLREHHANPQKFDSVTVYRPQGKGSQTLAVAIMDAQTIVIGDAQSIFSLVERLPMPRSENTNALFSRAASLDTVYDLWALLAARGALESQRVPFAGLVEGLRDVEAGITVSQGLVANISITAISETKARELRDQLGKLLKLAAKDEATRPELALIAKRPKFSVQGAQVALTIRVGQDEVESGLRRMTARSTPKTEVPSKPERQMIRIEGLDGGPRELLLAPNR